MVIILSYNHDNHGRYVRCKFVANEVKELGRACKIKDKETCFDLRLALASNVQSSENCVKPDFFGYSSTEKTKHMFLIKLINGQRSNW